MEENQLVECLRDLLNAYEYRERTEKSYKEEITMWREKFLNSLPKLNNAEKEARLWCMFLGIKSCDIGLYRPDHHIERIMRYLDESK